MNCKHVFHKVAVAIASHYYLVEKISLCKFNIFSAKGKSNIVSMKDKEMKKYVCNR